MSDTSSSRRVRSIVIAVVAFLALVTAGVVIAWQLTGAASISDLFMGFRPGGF